MITTKAPEYVTPSLPQLPVPGVIAPTSVQGVIAPTSVQGVIAPPNVSSVIAPTSVQGVIAPPKVSSVIAPKSKRSEPVASQQKVTRSGRASKQPNRLNL